MRRIQVIDLDGCISDDRHRRGAIDPVLAADRTPERAKDRTAMYDAYHRNCFLDPAVNLHEVREEHVVILTGRPLKFWDATNLWLREVAYIQPLFMIMRNNHDHRPSVILKRQMLQGLLDHNSYGIEREELVSAIDDRDDIVVMYRAEFGLEARIVRIGDEENVHG